jgi:hypothetical protein
MGDFPAYGGCSLKGSEVEKSTSKKSLKKVLTVSAKCSLSTTSTARSGSIKPPGFKTNQISFDGSFSIKRFSVLPKKV